MTRTDGALTKREVLKELGITDRLLKFWMNWYKLPLNRRGRGSTYPAATVETLRLIKRLADSRYFTMRFVRDLLAVTNGGDRSSVEASLNLCRAQMNRPGMQAFRTTTAASATVSTPPSPGPAQERARVAPAAKKMGDDLL